MVFPAAHKAHHKKLHGHLEMRNDCFAKAHTFLTLLAKSFNDTTTLVENTVITHVQVPLFGPKSSEKVGCAKMRISFVAFVPFRNRLVVSFDKQLAKVKAERSS